MSRRSIAHAERQVVETVRGGSKAGTVRCLVRVPVKNGQRPRRKFTLIVRGSDPNATGAELMPCTSVRVSRAKRFAKKHYGYKLYGWSEARNGWVGVA